jgi:hypothetical protein
MTIQELIVLLKPILPNLVFDEESDGEILIYSGFREVAGGVLEAVQEGG